MNRFVELISRKFEMRELPKNEFSRVKVGPMKFDITCYDVIGVGRVSYLKGKALFGLMKMETIMLTPLYVDAPIFSYDRIRVLKNDTFILEMYQTCKADVEYPVFVDLRDRYSKYPHYNLKKSWYDSIRVNGSISIKSKNCTREFDKLLDECIEACGSVIEASNKIELKEKIKLQDKYVQGLLDNGGSSTDMFIKKLGKEKTTILYKKYLFGTEGKA